MTLRNPLSCRPEGREHPGSGLLPDRRVCRETGVTVRTLRYYDRIGLLRPSAVSASGYRLYTDSVLLNLQQILALKSLGFSLGQIREFLAATPGDVCDSLQAQEEVMLEKRRRMDRVIAALRQARVAFDESPTPDWDYLVAVIRVIQMEQDYWRKY